MVAKVPIIDEPAIQASSQFVILWRSAARRPGRFRLLALGLRACVRRSPCKKISEERV
jgi:hypothetical protein